MQPSCPAVNTNGEYRPLSPATPVYTAIVRIPLLLLLLSFFSARLAAPLHSNLQMNSPERRSHNTGEPSKPPVTKKGALLPRSRALRASSLLLATALSVALAAVVNVVALALSTKKLLFGTTTATAVTQFLCTPVNTRMILPVFRLHTMVRLSYPPVITKGTVVLLGHW